jgi:hypothetical protein
MAGFQNWLSLDSPGAMQSQSGIPGTEFENWQNLSGPSDVLKKMSGIPDGGAIAPPPQTFGDIAQKAIAPTVQKFNNISNAFGQSKQGNQQVPTTQPVADYDFIHHLDKIQ